MNMDTNIEKIPKIIHYCWFGSAEIPEVGLKCIESWKKNMPEYEIKCWTEETFDINSYSYTRKAYEEGKFAFVSDYVRLKVLYEYGGIYMDIDEEVLKNFDELLIGREMMACFENSNSVMMGLLATVKHSKLISDFIDVYDNWTNSGNIKYIANPIIFTKLLTSQKSLILNGKKQELDGGKILILPNEYLCGYDFNVYKERKTLNTYAVQHYAGTWTNGKSSRNKKMHETLVNIIGENFYLKLKTIKKRLKGERGYK